MQEVQILSVSSSSPHLIKYNDEVQMKSDKKIELMENPSSVGWARRVLLSLIIITKIGRNRSLYSLQ